MKKFFLTALLPLSVAAQTSLNVTDYGAVGDAVQFTVQTTSNSPMVSVVGTNRFTSADIGKIIEVFRAGPWLHLSNNVALPYVVTNQDTICLITNVTNGTNLWGSIPQGWTKQAFCVVGTNNRAALQAAINAAGAKVNANNQNVTLNIPDGNYLVVGPKVMNPNYVMGLFDNDISLTISSGGLTLKGASTNAVLMGVGAGMNHVFNDNTVYGSYGHWNPLRGTLFQCLGPVANSQYPLVFQNLTFDGGLTNGWQNYNYFTLYEGNGDGWDTSHDALLDINPNWANPQMHQLKVFTNCVFQHWRGEMLKNVTSNAGGTNTWITIAGCSFFDGNASADNLYFGQTVVGNHFERLVKVHEYYQGNATTPSFWHENYWTNAGANPFSIVGANTNALPPNFVFSNNICYGGAGNLFHLSPAQNVSIVSNQFYGSSSSGIVFSSAGLQGNAICSNIVISANNFHDVANCITMDGLPVTSVYVSNNVANNGQNNTFISAAAGWKANIILSGNVANSYIDGAGVQDGGYFIILTNNSVGFYRWDTGTYSPTNAISYGNGIAHRIDDASKKFYLDDTQPGLMPDGAILMVTNGSTSTGAIYTTAAMTGLPAMLSSHQVQPFYWNKIKGGYAWMTNKIVPPLNLRATP